MRLNNHDLAGAISLAVINLGWTLWPARPAILNIPGLLFVLPFICLCPGYTCMALLFVQERPAPLTLIRTPLLNIGHPLAFAERLILSFGLSLALDILGGFALDLLPQGLQAFSWATLLGLLTMLFAVGALYRRHKIRERQPPDRLSTMRTPQRLFPNMLLLTLALLIVWTALWYASNTLDQQSHAGFTQLWLQSSSQAGRCAVAIGVQSYETAPTTYRITMAVNRQQVAVWPAVLLAPQNQWGESVSLPPDKSGTTRYVEVLLYRTEQPGVVYREVHMTLEDANKQNGQSATC